MSTIRTSIQVTDGMSPAFRSMTTAMNIVLNSFESLQRASHNSIDTNSIQAARTELARAETSFDSVEQQIREANQQQQGFNQSIRTGQGAADGLVSKIKGFVLAFAGMAALKKGAETTDDYINQNSRLALINDGLQTQAQLQDKIYQAAQRSRGVYGDTVSTVAKLGLLAKDAFSGNDETIAFAELMNKSFKISGASASEASNGMYQLTQAMASGRLQGDEFRSIMENAPMLAQAIAKYAGKSMGELREMSKEGEISSAMIKNALFSAADDINKKFETMPMTFGTIWTNIKNKAVMEFSTIMQKVNDFINSDVGASAISNISNGVVALASALGTIIDVVIAVSTFFNDNWSMIAPIIWGIIGALIVYNATMGISWLTTLKDLAVKGAHTISSWAQTAALIATTFAQQGLNAALALCPLTWIIMGIIILIAVFYAAVAAINHFAGTSISATGIIAGVFASLGAFLYNVVAYIWNYFASLAEFLVNVFSNPIYSVRRLFANLAFDVLDMCISMTKGFDSFATNLANAMIDGINKALGAWNSFVDVLNKFGGIGDKLGLGKATMVGHTSSITSSMENAKSGINAWVGEEPSNYWKAPKMEMKSIGGAYNAGYDFGKGMEEKFDISKILGGKDLGGYGDQAKFAAETAANTGKMKDSMSATEEDLKYLRDLAEQEVINKFTTAEIKVDMTNHNNINSEMDLDGVVAYMEEKIYETMTIAAEGVHK